MVRNYVRRDVDILPRDIPNKLPELVSKLVATDKFTPHPVNTGSSFNITTFLKHSCLHSRIAGPMCPVLDPAMVTTVNFFHGNEFYTATRAKLAWLLLAQH